MSTKTLIISLILSAAVAVALAGVADPPEPAGADAPGEAATHPDVGETTLTCDACHEQTTPEIHAAWYAGPHGLNGVKCFVCHGSRTERFAVEVPIERCDGCHAAVIPSMKAVAQFAGMEELDCFSCHPPHRLTPHAVPLDTPDEDGGAPAEENGGTR